MPAIVSHIFNVGSTESIRSSISEFWKHSNLICIKCMNKQAKKTQIGQLWWYKRTRSSGKNWSSLLSDVSVLVLLMREIYEVRHWDGLRRHDTHSKFLDGQFRHSSNINIITSTIWQASVLVLMMSEIYEVSIPCFMMISWGIEVILRLLPQQVASLQCSCLWREGFINYTSEIASDGTIYTPSFMKISTGL
jgi:hypothetical protein